MMLNQFIDDVVSKGAESVLPQNLKTKWLDTIFAASRNFLKTAVSSTEDVEEKDVLNDMGSLMLLSAVMEIAQYQNGYKPDLSPVDIPEDTLFEYISCYALSIIFESISRLSGIDFDKPDKDNIFDRDRLFDIEQQYPQLTDILNNLIIEM